MHKESRPIHLSLQKSMSWAFPSLQVRQFIKQFCSSSLGPPASFKSFHHNEYFLYYPLTCRIFYLILPYLFDKREYQTKLFSLRIPQLHLLNNVKLNLLHFFLAHHFLRLTHFGPTDSINPHLTFNPSPKESSLRFFYYMDDHLWIFIEREVVY